jgi:hypothetical protein
MDRRYKPENQNDPNRLVRVDSMPYDITILQRAGRDLNPQPSDP